MQPLPFFKDKNGNVVTERDLPKPKKTMRWTYSQKAKIVKAVKNKLKSREEILSMYNISGMEFTAWEQDYKKKGIHGLKLKYLRHAWVYETK
jgi:hypothetical protein